MNAYKYAWLIALIILVGLILRFGKSSSTILRDAFSGINTLVGSLTLSKFPGNTP